jgi:hypothetical protein
MNPNVPPPGAAPAKKSHALIWILSILAGLVILIGVTLAVGGYFLYRGARSMAHHPGWAVARLVSAVNPNVEVLSTDEAKGTITVRDKQTGKVITVNLQDAEHGKISFEGTGQGTVTVDGSGEGKNGTVVIRSPQGTMKFGSGAFQIPAWLPAYPGSSPQGTFGAQSAESSSGTFTFKVGDAVDKVSQYYQDHLKSAGFTITNALATTGASGAGGMVSAEDSGKKRTVVVTIGTDGGETTVAVMFTEKK